MLKPGLELLQASADSGMQAFSAAIGHIEQKVDRYATAMAWWGKQRVKRRTHPPDPVTVNLAGA